MKFQTAIGLSVALSILATNVVSAQDCAKKIKTETDKFTGDVTIYTPVLEPLSLTIVKKGEKTMHFLAVESPGITLNVGQSGAYIIFSDGSKFEKADAKVDAKANQYGPGYIYRAFILLTPQEVAMFSKKTVTDLRLYIYDREIKGKIAETFRCQVESLIKEN